MMMALWNLKVSLEKKKMIQLKPNSHIWDLLDSLAQTYSYVFTESANLNVFCQPTCYQILNNAPSSTIFRILRTCQHLLIMDKFC